MSLTQKNRVVFFPKFLIKLTLPGKGLCFCLALPKLWYPDGKLCHAEEGTTTFARRSSQRTCAIPCLGNGVKPSPRSWITVAGRDCLVPSSLLLI